MAEPLRRALVTGGAKRLGRVLALALAADGFAVAVHCHRSRHEGEAVVEEIRQGGGRAVLLVADLSREAEAECLVPAACEALGPLDLLVNNASHFHLDQLATASRASWDAHIETNLRAPVVLMQRFVAQLPEGAEGVVVNILDQRLYNLTPHFLSYSVSRVGLWGATQVLARELAPRVRVNAIGPGPMLPHDAMTPGEWDRLVACLPLRRGPSPEDIAAALRYVIAARAMTGQLLTVDGGQQMGWLTPGAPNVE